MGYYTLGLMLQFRIGELAQINCQLASFLGFLVLLVCSHVLTWDVCLIWDSREYGFDMLLISSQYLVVSPSHDKCFSLSNNISIFPFPGWWLPWTRSLWGGRNMSFQKEASSTASWFPIIVSSFRSETLLLLKTPICWHFRMMHVWEVEQAFDCVFGIFIINRLCEMENVYNVENVGENEKLSFTVLT